jgi:GNAT superfamily N-acetyltransferase
MRLISRLAEHFDDWKEIIQRDGVISALPSLGVEISHLPYRHLKFFVLERSLSETLPDFQPKIPLEIRSFQAGDIELVRQMDRPSEARQCSRRLESGYQGLVALYENQPAGYAWGCAKINPQFEKVQITLGPGDVLCNDVFTNPVFRGQGVQTALTLARFRLFRDLGYCRAICYIERGNAPSLAVWQRKFGSKIVGSVDFLRIGLWYRVRYT